MYHRTTKTCKCHCNSPYYIPNAKARSSSLTDLKITISRGICVIDTTSVTTNKSIKKGIIVLHGVLQAPLVAVESDILSF